MTQPMKTPLDYRCMVCNVQPGAPCVTENGEAKNGTHIARECEAALDMDLKDGERVLARHGFKHDGYGRDADTQVWVTGFVESMRGKEMFDQGNIPLFAAPPQPTQQETEE
jgi:hypothetical protein